MLICILIANFSANAQLYEVSLDEKIQQSSLIIEGKVIDQASYRSKNGEVYTANKIKVSKVLKGNMPARPEIIVVTEGGTIDDVTVSTHHLRKGEAQRVLNSFNIEGGLHIMGISAVDYSGSNCYDPMSPIDTTGLDCYLLNAVPDAITNAVKLYLLPNPVHQDLTFYIESSQQGVIYVRIFDVVGGLKLERQYEKSAKGLTASVESSDLLPAGMYLFNVSDGREGSLTTTFIKL